jgi:hypothetical protein
LGPSPYAFDPQPRRRNTGSTLRRKRLDRFDPYRGALTIVWPKQLDSQAREQRFHRSRQRRRQPDPFAAWTRRTWISRASTRDFRLHLVFHLIPRKPARILNSYLCKADTKPAKEPKLKQAEQKSLLLSDDEKLSTKTRIFQPMAV